MELTTRPYAPLNDGELFDTLDATAPDPEAEAARAALNHHTLRLLIVLIGGLLLAEFLVIFSR